MRRLGGRPATYSAFVKMLGKDGERMGGEHVRSNAITVLEVQKVLKIPFNGS